MALWLCQRRSLGRMRCSKSHQRPRQRDWGHVSLKSRGCKRLGGVTLPTSAVLRSEPRLDRYAPGSVRPALLNVDHAITHEMTWVSGPTAADVLRFRPTRSLLPNDQDRQRNRDHGEHRLRVRVQGHPLSRPPLPPPPTRCRCRWLAGPLARACGISCSSS